MSAKTKRKPIDRAAAQRRNEPVSAWRAWRGLQPRTLHPQAPPGTLYGVMTNPLLPWIGGSHTAYCFPQRGGEHGVDRLQHAVPGARCECGVRGDLDITALFDYGDVAADAGRYGAELRARGLKGWRDWVEVIGEVKLIGRRAPRHMDDTPTTLRAERGRVGDAVFFAKPLWHVIDDFQRVHPWSTAVRVDSLRDVLEAAKTAEGT